MASTISAVSTILNVLLRYKEVTDEIMDGKQSVVWLQALNRMHVQKSIIQWCLKSI